MLLSISFVICSEVLYFLGKALLLKMNAHAGCMLLDTSGGTWRQKV